MCIFCQMFGFIRSFFFFKQKTAYEMRISDWSSDVCSSDLEVLRLGHKHKGRKERIEAKQQRLQAALGLPDKEFSALRKRFPESYWIAEADDILLQNARHVLSAGESSLSIAAEVYPDRGAKIGRASCRERECQDG